MNDLQIREILIKDIFKKHPEKSNVKNLLIEEMVLCKGLSRIDVALVNGHMHGYEIKSSVDTLIRLNSQISHYAKCFDYLTVVASEKHIDKIFNNYPKWLGVCVVTETEKSLKINHLRRPTRNVYSDIYVQMQLLWKEELINLGKNLSPSLKLHSLSKDKIINALAPTVKKTILQQKIRETLKSRTTWRVQPTV